MRIHLNARRLLVLPFALVLGLAAGTIIQPEPAAADGLCPNSDCHMNPWYPFDPETEPFYECESSLSDSECDISGNGDFCTTGQCQQT